MLPSDKRRCLLFLLQKHDKRILIVPGLSRRANHLCLARPSPAAEATLAFLAMRHLLITLVGNRAMPAVFSRFS